MLYKLKDKVGLKELGNFGYEIYDIGLNEPHWIYEKQIKPYISICIDVNTRMITKNNDDESGILEREDIQDLIKSSLVEEVGD